MTSESPCRATCKLNADDLCIGCYRNIKEIVNWNKKSSSEKTAILKRIEQRRAELSFDRASQSPLRPITSVEYRKHKE